jgi:hypothetical protein
MIGHIIIIIIIDRRSFVRSENKQCYAKQRRYASISQRYKVLHACITASVISIRQWLTSRPCFMSLSISIYLYIDIYLYLSIYVYKTLAYHLCECVGVGGCVASGYAIYFGHERMLDAWVNDPIDGIVFLMS